MVQEQEDSITTSGVDLSSYMTALQSINFPYPMSFSRSSQEMKDGLSPNSIPDVQYGLAPCPNPIVDDYFYFVAKSGRALFEWRVIKSAFIWKLEAVAREMCTMSPSSPPSTVPLSQGDTESSPIQCVVSDRPCTTPADHYIDKLVTSAAELNGIPFTFQRLCELLVEPRRHYKRADKYFRALEKNINVVTTILPNGDRETTRSSRHDSSFDHSPQWSPNREKTPELMNGVMTEVEITVHPLPNEATPTRDERPEPEEPPAVMVTDVDMNVDQNEQIDQQSTSPDLTQDVESLSVTPSDINDIETNDQSPLLLENKESEDQNDGLKENVESSNRAENEESESKSIQINADLTEAQITICPVRNETTPPRPKLEEPPAMTVEMIVDQNEQIDQQSTSPVKQDVENTQATSEPDKLAVAVDVESPIESNESIGDSCVPETVQEIPSTADPEKSVEDTPSVHDTDEPIGDKIEEIRETVEETPCLSEHGGDKVEQDESVGDNSSVAKPEEVAEDETSLTGKDESFGDKLSLTEADESFGDKASVSEPDESFGDKLSIAVADESFGDEMSLTPPDESLGDEQSITKADESGRDETPLSQGESFGDKPSVTEADESFGDETSLSQGESSGDKPSVTEADESFGDETALSQGESFGDKPLVTEADESFGDETSLSQGESFGDKPSVDEANESFGNETSLSQGESFGDKMSLTPEEEQIGDITDLIENKPSDQTIGDTEEQTDSDDGVPAKKIKIDF